MKIEMAKRERNTELVSIYYIHVCDILKFYLSIKDPNDSVDSYDF